MRVPDRRFWSLVDRSAGAGGCWPFVGHRTPKGYGQVKRDGEVVYAHRYAFVLSGRVIGDGQLVRHACDNPPCCNPSHLNAGSAADNTRDMVERGRARGGSLKGEAHPAAVLSDRDVREVRRLVQEGLNYTSIARRYGVTRTPIARIAKGLSWTHVG